jgi:hypothetical protein
MSTADDDATRRILKAVDETLDLVKALGKDVTELRADVTKLGHTVDDFRAKTEDDFAIVKARLRRIETTQADHEDRISSLERGRK